MPGKKPIRYAVVGLGHIAQVAVLPAFAHARRNSRLVAVVSSDRSKRREVARRYGLDHGFAYDEFDECLKVVDAVYIALPNSMHAEYTIRAARAGVHVLCEKPMAVTVEECRRMIDACRKGGVKLMIAYRLHFETVNLAALAMARQGRLGELKFFNSSFSMKVRRGDIRTRRNAGGGTLYDIGVYCINAARNLFGAEPTQVSAVSINSGLASLAEIDETTAAILRFGNDRVASFVTSFNAADVASFRLVGTKGDLRVDPAYEYAEGLGMDADRRRKEDEEGDGQARSVRARADLFLRLHPERSQAGALGRRRAAGCPHRPGALSIGQDGSAGVSAGLHRHAPAPPGTANHAARHTQAAPRQGTERKSRLK